MSCSLNLWEILDHWTIGTRAVGWVWDQVQAGKLLKFKMQNPTWGGVWEGTGPTHICKEFHTAGEV